MKIVTIKSFLLFISTLLIAFSFPLQVMSSSPLPALSPYMVLVGVFLLTLLQKPYSLQLHWNARKPIMFMISVYLALVFFHSGLQVALFEITPEAAASVIATFVLPVMFFLYFRNIATSSEFHAVFFAITLAGLAVGVYFVFDSYSMLVLRELNDYSVKAFEYSQLRAPDATLNEARISIGYRSHGLLESHSVTASLIVQGCLAWLALIPKNHSTERMVIILIYGIMLLIGLNFTSIIGFTCVIFLFEYKGYILFSGSIPRDLNKLLQLFIVLFIFIWMLLTLLPGEMSMGMNEAIKLSLSGQVDLATGTAALNDTTYLGGLVSELIAINAQNISDFPPFFCWTYWAFCPF